MYPVEYNVEYPEGGRNRLSALVRIILAIPIIIVVALVTGNTAFEVDAGIFLSTFSGLFLATMLMILFRKKYPRWWFDFVLELMRFNARIGAYLFLLRDEYPSTDERQAVTLNIAYPDAEQLNRALPLFKWILAIPHYIVLMVLFIIGIFVVVISWVVIVVAGRQPVWAFTYLVGAGRWWLRVAAYAFLLSTDRYPPFRFGP